jgi:hypothetical protein
LRAYLGDEVSVLGRVHAASEESGGGYALGVTSFRTLRRRNPAGIEPRLGGLKKWSTLEDRNYGIQMRLPESFVKQDQGTWMIDSNFVDPAGVRTRHIWGFPREVYRASNLKSEAFAVYVDPRIRNEGTCLQFGTTGPEDKRSTMAGNVRYAQTVLSGVGMGTEAIDYHVHTFHHGFCYEFAVGFAQTDGGGMEGSTCQTQWLTESDE